MTTFFQIGKAKIFITIAPDLFSKNKEKLLVGVLIRKSKGNLAQITMYVTLHIT